MAAHLHLIEEFQQVFERSVEEVKAKARTSSIARRIENGDVRTAARVLHSSTTDEKTRATAVEGVKRGLYLLTADKDYAEIVKVLRVLKGCPEASDILLEKGWLSDPAQKTDRLGHIFFSLNLRPDDGEKWGHVAAIASAALGKTIPGSRDDTADLYNRTVSLVANAVRLSLEDSSPGAVASVLATAGRALLPAGKKSHPALVDGMILGIVRSMELNRDGEDGPGEDDRHNERVALVRFLPRVLESAPLAPLLPRVVDALVEDKSCNSRTLPSLLDGLAQSEKGLKLAAASASDVARRMAETGIGSVGLASVFRASSVHPAIMRRVAAGVEKAATHTIRHNDMRKFHDLLQQAEDFPEAHRAVGRAVKRAAAKTAPG